MLTFKGVNVTCVCCKGWFDCSEHKVSCLTCVYGKNKLGCTCPMCAKQNLDEIKVNAELHGIIFESDVYFAHLLMKCNCVPERLKEDYKKTLVLMKLTGNYDDIRW